MFWEGLTMLGFDSNNSNRAKESSPNKESNDSSDDFLENEPGTSKKMAQNAVFHPHLAPEEAFEQSHMIDSKIKKKNYIFIPGSLALTHFQGRTRV